jgi:hypothetical protein
MPSVNGRFWPWNEAGTGNTVAFSISRSSIDENMSTTLVEDPPDSEAQEHNDDPLERFERMLSSSHEFSQMVEHLRHGQFRAEMLSLLPSEDDRKRCLVQAYEGGHTTEIKFLGFAEHFNAVHGNSENHDAMKQ